MAKSRLVAVRFDPEVFARVAEAARRDDRSVSYFIQKIVSAALPPEELAPPRAKADRPSLKERT